MINKVEIKLMDYYLIINNNKCQINDKEIIINTKDIDNIIRIIRSWKNLYINNKVIGENKDYIIINDKYKYIFNNNYPDNINVLVSYIGDMYDR